MLHDLEVPADLLSEFFILVEIFLQIERVRQPVVGQQAL